MARSISIDQMLRDLFPMPGQPVKRWVLEARAERDAIVADGRRMAVPWHLDNCGSACCNVGPQALVYDMLTHDCCYECGDLAATVGE